MTGQAVSFTASHSGSAQSSTTITWNFGDGTLTAGATPTHAYTTAGTYHVTMIVSNGGQDVTVTHLDGRVVTFTREQIHERSRMIAIGIDARRQRFPSETPYRYQPLVGEEEHNRWNGATWQNVVKNYNLRYMYI